MPIFYDQLNRAVELPSTPKRIISIVPSQTELLFSLGLDKEVVGITKFCTHPADKFKSTTKVGGTKQLNIAKIKELSPDLIIANKEENERSQIEELMKFYPVWISDISDLSGALMMIENVGALVGREVKANELCREIGHQFDVLDTNRKHLTAAYLIWRKPYMVAGIGTFIDNMLHHCGLTNAFNTDRYPQVTEEMLLNTKPDVVFLSSEPYPFVDKHIGEFQRLLPNALIKLVDGEMFSWYGSRLLIAPAYFKGLIEDVANGR